MKHTLIAMKVCSVDIVKDMDKERDRERKKKKKKKKKEKGKKKEKNFWGVKKKKVFEVLLWRGGWLHFVVVGINWKEMKNFKKKKKWLF